jgi:hypothetical protein
MDETYIKVKGQWKYLYRAVDKGKHAVKSYCSENEEPTNERPSGNTQQLSGSPQ